MAPTIVAIRGDVYPIFQADGAQRATSSHLFGFTASSQMRIFTRRQCRFMMVMVLKKLGGEVTFFNI